MSVLARLGVADATLPAEHDLDVWSQSRRFFHPFVP